MQPANTNKNHRILSVTGLLGFDLLLALKGIIKDRPEEERQEILEFLNEGYADREPHSAPAQGPVPPAYNPPPKDPNGPAAYWRSIDCIAREVLSVALEWAAQESVPEGAEEWSIQDATLDAFDFTHEAHRVVDSDGWIIYYHKAQRVLCLGGSEGYSNHTEAWRECGIVGVFTGDTGIVRELNDILQTMAAYAMVQDVQDKIAELRKQQKDIGPFADGEPS